MLQPLYLADRALQSIGQILCRQPGLIEPFLKVGLVMDVQGAQTAQYECCSEPGARLRGDDAGIGVKILSSGLRGESADEKRRSRRQSSEQAAHDAILAGHEQDRNPEGMGHATADENRRAAQPE